MRNLKLYYIFFISLNLIFADAKLSILFSRKYYCLIKNFKYSTEFLRSSFYDTLKIEKDSEENGEVFTDRIDSKYVTNLDQFVWKFQTVDRQNYTFLITNKQNRNRYLCVTNQKLNTKRKLGMLELNNENKMSNNMCLWTVKDVNRQDRVFTIWNEMHKESIFAAENEKTFKRNLYLDHMEADSTQFFWKINCF